MDSPEFWEKFWNSEDITFGRKATRFLRDNYFSRVVAISLGEITNKYILEAGCGSCASLVLLASRCRKVVGVDYSKTALLLSEKKFNKKLIPNSKYELLLQDIRNMKFDDNSFDVVFNTGVIEHFSDISPLKEMLRVTKKSGRTIVFVPYKYSLYHLWYLILEKISLLKFYPWGKHKFYTKRQLVKALQDAGAHSVRVKRSFLSLMTYLAGIATR